MVATAYEDGSDDNISVAIAEFGEVKRDRATGTVSIEFEPPKPAEPTREADADGGGEADSGGDAHGGGDADGGGDAGSGSNAVADARPVDRRAFAMSKAPIRALYVVIGVAVASALLYVLLVL